MWLWMQCRHDSSWGLFVGPNDISVESFDFSLILFCAFLTLSGIKMFSRKPMWHSNNKHQTRTRSGIVPRKAHQVSTQVRSYPSWVYPSQTRRRQPTCVASTRSKIARKNPGKKTGHWCSSTTCEWTPHSTQNDSCCIPSHWGRRRQGPGTSTSCTTTRRGSMEVWLMSRIVRVKDYQDFAVALKEWISPTCLTVRAKDGGTDVSKSVAVPHSHEVGIVAFYRRSTLETEFSHRERQQQKSLSRTLIDIVTVWHTKRGSKLHHKIVNSLIEDKLLDKKNWQWKAGVLSFLPWRWRIIYYWTEWAAVGMHLSSPFWALSSFVNGFVSTRS